MYDNDTVRNVEDKQTLITITNETNETRTNEKKKGVEENNSKKTVVVSKATD